MPAPAREVLATEVGDLIRRIDEGGLTPGQLKDLLQDAVESVPVQELVGGSSVEADDEGYAEHVDTSNPLTRLAAACLVAEAADVMTHHYAREARQAGYTWDALAAAAGYARNQQAWWRWEKNARDWDRYMPGTHPGESDDVEAAEAIVVPRELPPGADGWMPAAHLARKIGRDARTIRAMAARGEVEVLERKGPSGRDRSLYRMPK